MKTLISAIALMLGVAATAFADEAHEAVENDCSRVMIGMNLLMPAVSVSSMAELSDDVIAILTPGKDYLGDSVHAVSTMYTPELQASMLANFSEYGASISVVAGTDGHGDPALWIYVWSQGPDACVWAGIDDRVYEERANAPNIFWDVVREWENENPEGVLVRTITN